MIHFICDKLLSISLAGIAIAAYVGALCFFAIELIDWLSR
jgi:hypothetical protein